MAADLVNPNPGYVGIDACARCHDARCAEFHSTRHFLAAVEPTADRMPPGFAEEPEVLSSPYWRDQYQLLRSGEVFSETVLRGASNPPRPGATDPPTKTNSTPKESPTFPIALVYGSGGKGDEVFFTWQGDELFELPLGWLHPTGAWAKQDYTDVGDAILRTATPRCLECHTTFFQHVLGTENEYRRQSILPGVTCERCHGPGAEHVAWHSAHPDAMEAQAIIRPATLPRDRQIDVCGQCHSNVIHHRGPLFGYQPGQPLEEHFRTLIATGIEKDHVTDQPKYLRQSRCYQASESLTCTTCHSPHQAEDAAAVANACITCHTSGDCTAQPRLPLNVVNACVDCHMPRTSRVAVKFHGQGEQFEFPVRPHDHRIAVHPAASLEVERDGLLALGDEPSRARADELTVQLVALWLAEGSRLQDNHRYLAAVGAYRDGRRATAGDAALELALNACISRMAGIENGYLEGMRQMNEGRNDQAVRTLKALLDVVPTAAHVHAKLGTAYELVGQHDKAVEHWKRVEECDPDTAYGHNMIGWTAFLGGRIDEALAAYAQADRLFPHTAEIHYRWGLALLRSNDQAAAEKHFREAIAVSPRHAGAFQGLSHSLRGRGAAEEAVAAAQLAAEETGFKNVDVLMSLADAQASADRPDDADKTLRRAIELARLHAPQMLPMLEQRRTEIRRPQPTAPERGR